ncbi:putative phospholipid-binding protein MlaC precursor [mine drainage metagenome]|uniref:Putative phospholipid-binding protein MlaC n=1 Tax=mine drainage metagenome TaxID=410659 RepID=A0A1J5QSM6_9ZZZZ
MRRMANLLAVAAFAFSTGAMAETLAPDVMIKTTASEVLDILKKDKDIQNGDTKKIVMLTEEKILPHFNFERMSQLVLGRNWHKSSKEQQDKFVVEFRNLLVRTYSSALAKYRNQSIDYKPLRAQTGDARVVVKTLIMQSGSQPVKVDYSLEKDGEEWKVVDVTIEDVSIVTSYRSQFEDTVKKDGMDSLIQKLADKNRQGGIAIADKKQI